MMDSGIRRGHRTCSRRSRSGAQFVFVGRPFLYAAAIAGDERRPPRDQAAAREEVDRDMALLGITTLVQMTRERLAPRG